MLSRRSLFFVVLLTLGFCAVDLANSAKSMKLLVLAQFPLLDCPQGILVPVKLEGEDVYFMVDTGTTLNIYDSAYRDLLGKAVGKDWVEFPGKVRTECNLYDAPETMVGSLRLKTPHPVLCRDLARLRRISGFNVRGVIGMQFLKNYIFSVDYDEKCVEFSLPLDTGLDPKTILERLNDEKCHNPIMLPVRLPGGKTEKFMIDTGSDTDGALGDELFDELLSEGRISLEKPNVACGLADSKMPVACGRLEWVEFSGKRYSDLVLLRSHPSRLGMGFFSRYNFIMDFVNGQMYLLPRKNAAETQKKMKRP